MMNINFDDLTLENIGDWPKPIKMTVIVIVFLLVIVLGYFFDIENQFDQLRRAKTDETVLKQQFEMKQGLAINLGKYIDQMKEMKKSFGDMLQKLPSKTEIPLLLEDVSEAGISAGLKFKLFKPLVERDKAFYAELPIEISVIGRYHQLATFASKVANLKRIVVLDDFSLKHQAASPGASRRRTTQAESTSHKPLILHITAKTYRYIDEDAL